MKIQYQKPILIASILAFITLTNCIKKAEFLDYGRPEEFAAGMRTPLINSSITLGQAIGNQTSGTGLIEASDKSYYFTYADSVVSDSAGSMINFDPISSSQAISIPGAPLAIPLPSDTVITYNYNLQFDNIVLNSDVSLLYLLLKDGLIDLNVNSTFNQNVTYEITLNSIVDTKNSNKPLTIKDSLIYPATVKASPSVNLKDYKIVMSDAGALTTSIKAGVKVTVKSSGQNMPTSAQDINFSFSITNLKMDRLVGKIKKLTFPTTSQTTPINVFNNEIINKIKFADPSIKFSFENSFGVPIKVDLGQIEALKGSSNIPLTYAPSAIDSLPKFSLGYPDTTKFGQTVKSSVSINKNNCPNLIDFLYSSPDNLKYSIGGEIGDSVNYSFIKDNSKVKVKYELKVPIYGKIDSISMTKRIGYKFPEIFDIDTITFITNIKNHIPLNVRIQIYLTDGDTTNILDSLFYRPTPLDNMNIFDAATSIDSEGKALKPTVKKTFISRNAEWYDKVALNTRFMLVVGTFYSPEGKNVRFYSDQGVDVNVSWAFKGRIALKSDD